MADKPAQHVDSAPDPDEDDLDDLDDILDSFEDARISAKPASATAPAASGPGRPPISQDAPTDEDFAKQLQAGMSSLIGELGTNPEMQAEFEKMMQELIAAGAAPTDQEAGQHLRAAAEAAPKGPEESTKPRAATASSSSSAGIKKKSSTDFGDTIRKTMERIQASDATVKESTASAAGNASEEQLLAQMMKELTGDSGEGEEGFNTMLMNMMAHLTNKEILYDPMKELHDKYPSWLAKNSSTLSSEDLDRYKGQQKLVREIVERFERKSYSDNNEEDREYIVERMQSVRGTVTLSPFCRAC
jgi:peroxin-19